jgi:hypothetical protein
LVSATVFLVLGVFDSYLFLNSSLSHIHPLFERFIFVILVFNISVVNLFTSMTPFPLAPRTLGLLPLSQNPRR